LQRDYGVIYLRVNVLQLQAGVLVAKLAPKWFCSIERASLTLRSKFFFKDMECARSCIHVDIPAMVLATALVCPLVASVDMLCADVQVVCIAM
jgi:hypothetical protein